MFLLCVSADARSQASSTSAVPGRQLRVPVHGGLFGAARAPPAPSAATVSAPGPGSADIVFAGGRVPAARFAEPAPPAASASRGRRSGRGRAQRFRVRIRAAIQMLQDGRQIGGAR